MILYLVRHGECVANTEVLLTGQLDSPLTALGLRQAAAVGSRLAREPISAVYASDLCRAFVTGEHIARHHRLEPIPAPLLRECGMGRVTGFTLPEFEVEYPTEYRLWRENALDNRPPGGERFSEVITRTGEWLDQALAQHSDGETIVAAAHAGTIAALMCAALGLPEAAFLGIDTNNASLSRLHYNGRWTVNMVNDICHLSSI